MDEKLAKQFALKEYFPVGIAEREERSTVRPRFGSSDDYAWGMQRFLAEAQHLARFEHPNIVDVVRVFDANNTAYIVLGFQAGRDLAHWLRELQGHPTQEELDLLLRPILDALAKVHANGLLHRDLAPDNIYVRDDGSPVLLDFGSARQAVAQHTGTLSSLVKGGYSPPELYSTKGSNQGPWTDIYSLGATLYRAVAGTPPDPATDRLLTDELVPLVQAAEGTYRPGFLAAVDWALRIDPKERPQNVEEWNRALFDVSPHQDVRAEPAEALSKEIDAHVVDLALYRGLSQELGVVSSEGMTRRRLAVASAIAFATIVVAALALPGGRQLLWDAASGGPGFATRALCSFALDAAKSDWSQNTAAQWAVTAAHGRGLSVNDCRHGLGLAGVAWGDQARRATPGQPAQPDEVTTWATSPLCESALNGSRSDWDPHSGYSKFVTEAKRRGLSVSECRQAIGLTTTDSPPMANQSRDSLCRMALNSNRSAWDSSSALADYVAEAWRRNLTVIECQSALNEQVSPSAGSTPTIDTATSTTYVCRQALNLQKTDWDVHPPFVASVAEARRRGLTVEQCRLAVGLPPASPTASPSATPTPASTLEAMSSEALCANALNGSHSDWDPTPSFSSYVSEAQRRYLTVEQCQAATGSRPSPEPTSTAGSIEATATASDICRQALNTSKTDWDTGAAYAPSVAEVRRRGLTIEQCRLAMGLPATGPTETQVSQPPPAGVTFDITNNSGSRVDVAFFDKSTHIQQWPEPGRVFIVGPSEQHTYPFTCNAGEAYCYGAWVEGDALTPFWGTGRTGKEGCTRCCLTCSPGSQTSFTLNQSDWRRPLPTLTWRITNSTGQMLSVAFYSDTRQGHGWPDWNRNWSLPAGQTSFPLNCVEGEKICYGAWDNSNVSGPYWGVGPEKSHGCENCCGVCNGGEMNMNLTGASVE
jgi:hypothetical protein